jgi:hypothetical protein
MEAALECANNAILNAARQDFRAWPIDLPQRR